jgi:hypothetical protein
MAWYGIPFGFATIMGLGCAALTDHPIFPTFPHPLSAAQNATGLSAPAAAVALLGKGGAGLLLLLLFMAVTSSTSAELIAVSSLLTFDVYKTYIRPSASNTELVKVSHYAIIVYAASLAGYVHLRILLHMCLNSELSCRFCCILNAVSVNLTWILTVLGVIVGGAALPVGLILTWERMSLVAVIASPWIGLCIGLVVWFVVTSQRSGLITVATTGNPLNALAGNIATTVTGLLCSIVLSYIFPAKYTSNDPVAIARMQKINGTAQSQAQQSSDEKASVAIPHEETEDKAASDVAASNAVLTNLPSVGKESVGESHPAAMQSTANGLVEFLETSYNEPMDPAAVRSATRLAVSFNALFVVVVVILVPFSLFGSSWIFSRAGFRGWCVVSFLWVWVSMFICVVWPLLESRTTISKTVKGIVRDIGRGGTRRAAQSAA